MFKRKQKQELIIYNSIELFYSRILEGEAICEQRTNDIVRMVCEQLEERGLDEPFCDTWVEMGNNSVYDSLSLTTVKSRNDGDISIWVKLTPMDKHMKEMCRIDLNILKQEMMKIHSEKMEDRTMNETEQKVNEVKKTIGDIIRTHSDWLQVMTELCILQTDFICEDMIEEYPMEIVEFEKDGVSITNPFVDESGRYELENPLKVYGMQNIKNFCNEMNEKISQYVEQEQDTTLRWDQSKAQKLIDIYCRAMSRTCER